MAATMIKRLLQVPTPRWLTPQWRFNRAAAAVYSTLLCVPLVWTFWWIDHLSYVTGIITAAFWFRAYLTCGGRDGGERRFWDYS